MSMFDGLFAAGTIAGLSFESEGVFSSSSTYRRPSAGLLGNFQSESSTKGLGKNDSLLQVGKRKRAQLSGARSERQSQKARRTTSGNIVGGPRGKPERGNIQAERQSAYGCVDKILPSDSPRKCNLQDSGNTGDEEQVKGVRC